MGSTDRDRAERRVRVAYELGRLRGALLGVLPVIVVVALAAYFTNRPGSALSFGSSTIAVGALMLWYGRDLQRAVLPGIAAGLIPLALALVANHIHACGPDGCTSLCVPACASGGVVAGIAVAWVGNRRRAGLRFWSAAVVLVMLTGAMGCSCIGYSGLGGLALGVAAGVVPGLLRRALSARLRS